jgi:hypothetical protein
MLKNTRFICGNYMNEILQKYKFINDKHRINPNLTKIVGKYPDIVKQIIDNTCFLEGEPSLQERIFVIISNITQQPTCKVCSVPLRFIPSKKSFQQYCSSKCAANDNSIKAQKVKKRLSDKVNLIKKIKEAKLKQSEETKKQIKLKREATIINRYGSKESFIEQNKQKQQTTNLERYGVKYCSQHDAIRQKIKEQHNKTNKDQQINNSEWLSYQHTILQKTIGEIAEEKGVSKHLIWARMNEFNIDIQHHFKSKPQQIIVDFLIQNNIEHQVNVRDILPDNKELDIFIPSANVAIEINGIFWHSEINGKNASYHLQKTNLCKTKNIKLLHFWDKEILEQPNIVKSIIVNTLGLTKNILYARKCKINTISTKDAEIFHEANHLGGSVKSKYNYGLFYDNTLVQVLSLSKNRYKQDGMLEIVRFSSLLNYIVVGGFSKLLTHAIKNTFPVGIITYNDLRYTTGNVYNKTGFTFVENTKPNYFYFSRKNCHKLYSRIYFQKHKQRNLLDYFDNNLTEWENMKNNGYDRIWDCGNGKWILMLK